ncbi:hypothetical protein BDZ91DRAFT_98576 [Kalaharituber pfeilii]|nr:hypothetical protein BDZ91DRAFT_98576 [Kalaharituber pfeilii]
MSRLCNTALFSIVGTLVQRRVIGYRVLVPRWDFVKLRQCRSARLVSQKQNDWASILRIAVVLTGTIPQLSRLRCVLVLPVLAIHSGATLHLGKKSTVDAKDLQPINCGSCDEAQLQVVRQKPRPSTFQQAEPPLKKTVCCASPDITLILKPYPIPSYDLIPDCIQTLQIHN